MKRRIYLDYNASSPLVREARSTMISALDLCANASSLHEEGRIVRCLIETARSQVASLVNGQPEHVVFTSGASEAASMLLQPVWRERGNDFLIGHLYVSAADHPCFLAGGRFFTKGMSLIAVQPDGLVDLNSLSCLMEQHDQSKGKALVAIHMVNNETGVVQPIEKAGEIVHHFGGIFIVDAVQAAGRLALDMRALPVDHLVLSSHKTGGPKGAGAIISQNHYWMPYPLIPGGGQEGGYRGGTENFPSIVGFGSAALVALDRLEKMSSVCCMRDRFEKVILDLCPGAVVHGVVSPRVGNTSFFSLPNYSAQMLGIAFDLAGVSLSSGSACSSGRPGPSHVLQAMGISLSFGALRISIGVDTTEEDLQFFSSSLSKILARCRVQKTLE